MLADSIHMFIDSSAVLIGIFASNLVKKSPSLNYPNGFSMW